MRLGESASFARAAADLIFGTTDPKRIIARLRDEPHSAESLAFQVCEVVRDAFTRGGGPEWAHLMSNMLKVAHAAMTIEDTRALAVLCIPKRLAAYRKFGLQMVAQEIRADLFVFDEEFRALEKDDIAAKLEDYAQTPTRSTHGAERILAELMVENEIDALGINVSTDVDVETETDRVRSVLAKAVSKHFRKSQ